MKDSASRRESVVIERMATGGAGVGRLADGLVVFIEGALPGETVTVEVEQLKRRWARGNAIEITRPSADRVDVRCPHAIKGQCGGCDWLHVDRVAQRGCKAELVREQLQRLGAIPHPDVRQRSHAEGQRTTVRCAVRDGRAGFRARKSSASFWATECRAAHPLIEQLMVEGHFGDANEVVLRVGTQTGERLVLTDGDPDSIDVPDDVVIASPTDTDAHYHEIVAGHRFRISAKAFFQASHAGAEALVAAVGDALSGSDGRVADLYAGVGLFGATVAKERLAVSVESNGASVGDARHNVAHGAIVHEQVERWTPIEVSTVIADPPRAGLQQAGVEVVGATGADRLVLVSCDPAALGRDAALLIANGWKFQRSETVDLFPDTSRIEAVSTFCRD